MPLSDEHLVIEPSYPFAKAFAQMARDDAEERAEEAEVEIRNTFWSWHRRSDILVWREKKTGKIQWGPSSRPHGLHYALQTLGCSDAWGIEQEGNAVHTLGRLLKHRAFKQYLTTGMFLETSKRSGVCYIFRRLRPTVAFTMTGEHPRILAAFAFIPSAITRGAGLARCVRRTTSSPT